MADDFERAVLIVFNGAAVDAALKERAEAFVNEIKRRPDVWQLCTERFSVTAYQEVRFWTLQTLHEVIRNSYGALPAPAKDMVKAALMTWVTRDCNNPQVPLPPFLRNKVAQTLVAVLQHEYPAAWPGFFQDLLRAMLPGSQLAAAGVGGQPSGTLGPVAPGCEGVVDMWCRILVSVDEDLVSLDIPRSQDESKLSMHVKDSMREHSIADVAAAWYMLVEAYAAKAPELAAAVLATMQRYINWIDISLVANDKFIGLLEGLLDSSVSMGLRGAAAECLAEIVSKRMDASAKLALVQSMNIVPRCAAWASSLTSESGSLLGDGGDDEAAEALALKLSKLLCALAGEVMEALKRVENGVISLSALGIEVGSEAASEATATAARANALLDQLLPALLTAFRAQQDDVALPLLPFMSAYVARLKTLQKRNGGLGPEPLAHVRAMLEGCALCARFPLRGSANDLPSPSPAALAALAAAKDEQSEVQEKRHDLFILFKNLAKLAWEEAISLVGRMLQAAVQGGSGWDDAARRAAHAHAGALGLGSPGAPGSPQQPVMPNGRGSMSRGSRWQDVELAVTLLYEIGEAAPAEEGGSALGQNQSSKGGPQDHPGGPLATLVTALGHACAAAGDPGGAGFGAGAGAGSPPLPASGHRLVALAVLETSVRYARVLQQSPALLPGITLAFLDSRGMGHPSDDVSTRACYLFCRLCKVLRTQMRSYLASLLPALQPHLARVATSPLADTPANQVGRDASNKALAPATAVVDDRLYVFEAVGLLLGQEEVGAEEQAVALGALLTPLTAQVESNLRSRAGGAASPGLIVQALEAVVRLSKGFKTDLLTRTRPQLGRMFARVLEAALPVPREFPGHRLLRARFISAVHRLVEALQTLLLPYLPAALEILVGPAAAAPTASPIGPNEVPDLTDVLALSTQLVARFKDALAPLMTGLMPVVVERVHFILANWDWSGRAAAPAAVALQQPGGLPGSTGGAVTATLEEVREAGELQRAYYSLLHGIVTAGMASVLLTPARASSSGAAVQAPSGHVILEAVVGGLTRGAATHVDPGVRRTCLQVYCRLVGDWCGAGGAEAVPGFRRYAMEHLGGEACVLGVLRAQPPLDVRDPSTLVLLQDVSAALKLVAERCGDAFAAHLMGIVAPAAGLPAGAAQQLVLAVSQGEVKDVREVLRGLLAVMQQAGGRS